MVKEREKEREIIMEKDNKKEKNRIAIARQRDIATHIDRLHNVTLCFFVVVVVVGLLSFG